MILLNYVWPILFTGSILELLYAQVNKEQNLCYVINQPRISPFLQQFSVSLLFIRLLFDAEDLIWKRKIYPKKPQDSLRIDTNTTQNVPEKLQSRYKPQIDHKDKKI